MKMEIIYIPVICFLIGVLSGGIGTGVVMWNVLPKTEINNETNVIIQNQDTRTDVKTIQETKMSSMNGAININIFVNDSNRIELLRYINLNIDNVSNYTVTISSNSNSYRSITN
jgi:hypothetical protein